MKRLPFARVTLAALACTLSSCSHRTSHEAPSPVSPEKVTEPRSEPRTSQSVERKSETPRTPFEGTIGIVDVPRPAQAPATVTDVRAGRHPGFDRFVWQFSGDVPGYHIEYIDKPVRQCGSGEVTAIAGDAWLEVRIHPSYAHTEEGAATVEREHSELGLEVALELERTCDFEAVTTWVVGVRSPNSYRVLELTDPPRLVVDLEHSWER